MHKKCAHLLPSNCQITAENAVTPGLEQMSVSEQHQQQANGQLMAAMAAQQQGHQPMDTSSDSMMIPLARLPGSASSRSVRHAGQMGQIICEGWLIHFLLQERERRRLRHYWVLANGTISLFSEYNDGEGKGSTKWFKTFLNLLSAGVNPNRVFRQIHLAEIIALIPYEGPSLDPK